MLNIAILPVGQVARSVLHFLQHGLLEVFLKTEVDILNTVMPIPEEAYDSHRRQYHSTYVLNKLSSFLRKTGAEYALGVADADLYVPRLNFVFGEAQCPGNVAIISLSRLRPEFYGEPPNNQLFLNRALKEAVHEIGHTLGLQHCTKPFCVMFFSNSIQDTDRKRAEFCEDCSGIVQKVIEH